MNRRLALIAVAGALALGSCTYEYDLKVSGPLAAPRFSAATSGLFGTQRACIRRAEVTADGADEKVWEVLRDAPAPCLDGGRLTYGETPPRFLVVSGPRPLQAGVTYHVRIEGAAGSGSGRVTFADGAWRVLEP